MNKEKVKSELVEINNDLTNKNTILAQELAEKDIEISELKVELSELVRVDDKKSDMIEELNEKNTALNKKITDLYHKMRDEKEMYNNLVAECAEVKIECEEWERAKYRVEDIKDKALEINNIKSDENKKLNLLILEAKDKIETMIGEKQEDERRRANAIVKYNRLKASIKKEFEHISIKLEKHVVGDALSYLGACDGRINIEHVERFAKYSEDVAVYRCLEGIIKSDNLKNK
jgi:DNA repair exonuclease SbcCD ATPase subunit